MKVTVIQNTPLIQDAAEIVVPGKISFKNFNEKEEATCIDEITLLRHSWIKAYLVVPVLSVLTLFFLPLKMYWDNALNTRMKYSAVQTLH